jgi:membrane peptidoglycan carboxypeptidase
VAKKPSKSRNMSVYSNLTHKRKTKKDATLRKKAEYLASLPKHPVKRTLYRMHPKRIMDFWFSKKGAFFALKLAGIGILLVVVLVGALFAYYRKDLDAIRPGELAKRVQSTVTRYEDRNGVLLYEDKGLLDYKLVVDGKNITDNMKKATVAIEDKDFYKHGGVSLTGITRSLVNNANGGSTQGGSTLTQQLVKQVFFADEAQKRGLNGVPRKIKEMILSIEVERMYNKEQILDLYLNESPYGGPRNGVESGAQAYFHKTSKDLTLAEAALLAGIPNQPGLYDPYNVEGHEALIARQHKVLTNMLEQGYITQKEADEAKAYPIIDHIQPEQLNDIKAPHFVQMVKSQLASELGKVTVGRGGLTVKTTLDSRVQTKLEEAMTDMFNTSVPRINGFSNGAATIEDNATGQIIALLGSRDYNYEGYGQDNAATAFIQPGSSIKPFVYASLFSQQPNGQANYGSGSILSDVKTTFPPNYTPKNAGGDFRGNINIRQALATSRNIPVIKAMSITGVPASWATIRAAGNDKYCTQGQETQAGLSSAIGGCTTRQIDHVNAYATLARGGVYKPHTTVLEVKNSQGDVLKQWKDESKQVIDPQVTYILSDILNDANARRNGFTSSTLGFSYGNTGIRTASKTGTSDMGGDTPKDVWEMSYSPAITVGVWLGNSDTTPLSKNANSLLPTPIVDKMMRYVHQDIYGVDGRWTPNDWFTQPAGIQKINNELYPSWYSKEKAQPTKKVSFDKISKKKATACTPESAKIDIDVTTFNDPFTKKDVVTAAEGYDAAGDDDTHKCDDTKPQVTTIQTPSKKNGTTYTIKVGVSAGTNPISSVEIKVGGTIIATLPGDGGNSYQTDYTFPDSSTQTISVTILDSVLYSDTKTLPGFTP